MISGLIRVYHLVGIGFSHQITLDQVTIEAICVPLEIGPRVSLITLQHS